MKCNHLPLDIDIILVRHNLASDQGDASVESLDGGVCGSFPYPSSREPKAAANGQTTGDAIALGRCFACALFPVPCALCFVLVLAPVPSPLPSKDECDCDCDCERSVSHGCVL